MKKAFIFTILTFFLVGFVFATGQNGSGSENSISAQVQTSNSGNDSQIQNQVQASAEKIDAYKTRVIQRVQNRLQNTTPSNCPEECTCTGSVTQCRLQNGAREMTIRAGNSGNTIVQVRDQNMSTNVTLYKADGKIYGIFNGNNTRSVEILPDQARARLAEKIKAPIEDTEIKLDENGTYQIETRKRARLFGFIPIKEKVRMQMNSETGEIERIKNTWWGFLAKDETILGNTCATVSPNSRNECCVNKGFDFYNNESGECE